MLDIQNQKLKHIRTSLLHMTQEEFAGELEISPKTVASIEQGKLDVSHKTALAICKKFGYSMDYIYGLTEDKNDTAGTMLLYLKKLFEYRTDPECDKYPHILTVRKCVMDFLNGYAQANRLFSDGVIPESAFTPWVEKLKADFNSAMEADGKNEEFCLVPKADFGAFLAYTDRSNREIVSQAIKSHDVKFTSEAAEQNFIDNAIRNLVFDKGEIKDFDSYLESQKQSDPGAFRSNVPVPIITKPIGLGGAPDAAPLKKSRLWR